MGISCTLITEPTIKRRIYDFIEIYQRCSHRHRRADFIGLRAKEQNAKDSAQDVQKLTLLLDWFVNPNHAAIIIAKQQGYFDEQGLDVEITEPADPSMPPKLVASNQADIAVDYQPQLQQSIAQGLPLVRIGTVINTPLNSLVILKDSNITKLEGLKAKNRLFGERV